jgi:hypothetical protein
VPVHTDGAWRAAFEGRRGWKALNSEHVANPYLTDREGVLGQALTSSRISTLSDAEREEIRRELIAVLDRYPDTRGERIEIPYVTDIYWTAKR